MLGGLWFWTQLKAIRVDMRPIYEQMGILPARTTETQVEVESVSAN
jgi:hypothetical protein